MYTIKNILCAALSLAIISFSLSTYADNSSECFLPEAYQSMDELVVELSSAHEMRQISVLIADNDIKRAAGFQSICDKDATKPMLFIFDADYRPRFHMNNVKIPLMIYFIDAKGQLVDRFLMPIYQIGKDKPLYQASENVRYALEVPIILTQSDEFFNQIDSLNVYKLP